MTKRGPEPFVWLMFSAGGMAAALVLPVLLFLLGVAFPLGWVDPPEHGHILAVLSHPLAKLGIFGICALSLVHWAHRFRFTLRDGLTLGRYDAVIATVCYGGAVAGTVFALTVLF